MGRTTTPFHWLTAAVFLALLVIPLAQEGMFMDGLLYAVVAHNQAEGFGTFWEPRYSVMGMAGSTIFREHPPLTFGLQAAWFRVLGDGFWVERLYCLATALLACWCLVRIWRTVVPHDHPAHVHTWWPVLLWIIVPPVHWCYQNNLQENTMGLFTLLAVLFILRADARHYWASLAAGGAFVFLAMMAKGPPGAFPLAVPVAWWFARRQGPAWRSFAGTAWMTLVTTACFATILLLPEARANLGSYVNERLLHRIEAQPTVDSRFSILFDVVPAMLGPLVLASLILLLARRNNTTPLSGDPGTRRSALGMALIAACGILPLMLTLVQKAFYMAPALPFLSMAVALFSAPALSALIGGISPHATWPRSIRRLAMVAIGAVFLAATLLFGRPSRDADMLHDVARIGATVPRGALISAPEHLWNEWNLQSYLLRYHAISIDAGPTPHSWRIEAGFDGPSGYEQMPLGTRTYTLWRQQAGFPGAGQ